MTDNSFEQTRFQSEASTAVDGRPNYLIAGLFFLIPLVFYLSLIPRWSLSGDELFTLGDSSGTLSEIFRTQIKPIYYWICHFALLLPFREEICIRLPSAIAAALIAPTFYLFLFASGRSEHHVGGDFRGGSRIGSALDI